MFGVSAIAGAVKIIAIIAALSALGLTARSCYRGFQEHERTRIENQAIKDRLQDVRDATERERLMRELPRRAKERCAVEGRGTRCCQPDAVKLPECTKDD